MRVHVVGVPDEIELLKKQLADVKAENELLRLQLGNVTILYKEELTASGKLAKLKRDAPVTIAVGK
jgi:hypothetical protein